MDNVDKIYELISKDNSSNTFYDNSELFMQFYYHNMDIIYGGPKVIEIFKYILSLNLDDENEEYPFINSKIFDAFNRYEQRITQSVYSKGDYSDEYVESLFKLLDEYYFFHEHKDKATLTPLYSEDTIIRDVTGAMMILLNSSFFNISNDNIKRMMETIKNNIHLQKIIESGTNGNKLLDKEYLFDYAHRFLFNAYFCNQDSIDSDELLIAIKEGRITDRETFIRIIKSVDIGVLLNIFGNDISLIIDVIEKNFTDENIRIDIGTTLFGILIKESKYNGLFNFIKNDNRSNLYLTTDEINTVYLYYPYSQGTGMSEEDINYYFDNNLVNKVLLNLNEELKHNNWSEETRNRVKEACKDIKDWNYDFNDAIGVLDDLFKNQNNVSVNSLMCAIKTILRKYVGSDDIEIYFGELPSTVGGFYCAETDSIVIDIGEIIEMCNTKNIDNNPKKLHVLDTIFHEGTHAIQHRKVLEDDMNNDYYIQYKEDVLRSINLQYYDSNYHGISYEQEARICGAHYLVDLLLNYFPYMTNSINHYSLLELKEKQYLDQEKQLFELSDKLSIDDALDKIISINPDIVRKNSVLSREYNKNGVRISKQTDEKSR